MPNVLHLTVENPEEILNAGAYAAGAILRLQSGAADSGPFADVSGTGSTPTVTVITGVRAYTGYDPAGTSTTWYRTRYENAGATRVSDWSAVFQVGAEEAGLICSLYNVKQALGIPANDVSHDEDILDDIVAVTDEIESVTGRDFTGARSDVTFRIHTRAGKKLWFPKGLQSIATLGVATTDQPASGGVYGNVTDWYLDPPDAMREPYWPATVIRFPSISGSLFYDAAFGAQITGKPGWAQVPPRVARIGETAACAYYATRGKAGPRAVIGPSGGTTILRDISPADWNTLLEYRTPRA